MRLKPGRERSLQRWHPWVFSGAVQSTGGEPAPGETLRVEAADGRFLAWADFSPASQIRARVQSFCEDEFPDEAFLQGRIAAALDRRRGIAQGTALRLVHAESDALPGLIADRYGDTIVVQILSAGAERRRGEIVRALGELSGARAIFERSDAETRSLEGLPLRVGPLLGDAPGGPVEILEHGLRYRVDVAAGQKTGFYLDQRDSRARIRDLAAGCEVLDCFAHTGGFALAAVSGGARSVLAVESSAPALALARQNAALNGVDTGALEWLEGDVFEMLRRLRQAGRSFDLVVLDPPKFAPTAQKAAAAARGYKDINLNALKLLRRGGLLATFSCSGGVCADLFQKIVAGAAADAGVAANIEARLQAPADHPVRLAFPEGEYLKGLLLRRV
ncbi:MAG: class I SAM-dependent rRNA methyltransferase [Burkholderiales bacterium]|nr:class I SAM-dependent rRNA methyltransferase [Burkholderiales bacterium]